MAKGVTDQRTCAKCQQSRPVAAFYARTRGGYQSVCRECYSLYRVAQVAADPHLDTRRDLWKNYRLRPDDYARMIEQQGGRCAICGTDDPGARRWNVDHDHSCCPTSAKSCGKCIRGLLCGQCNRMLGCAKDSVDVLRAAIDYLGGV